MEDKKKCKKKDNSCPKEQVKKQLNDLQEISRTRKNDTFRKLVGTIIIGL